MLTEADDEKPRVEAEEAEALQHALVEIDLFARLSPEALEMLAESMTRRVHSAGDVVAKIGDNSEFIVIFEGVADLTHHEKDTTSSSSTTLTVGDGFGEEALLYGQPYTSGLVAKTPMVVYTIDGKDFTDKGLRDLVCIKARKAVGGGATDGYVSKEPTPKTEKEKQFIVDALRANKNLQTVVSLSDAQVHALAGTACKETVPSQFKLITHGDIQADYLYIVKEGKFRVITGQSSTLKRSQTSQSLRSGGSDVRRSRAEKGEEVTLAEGACFGEVALLYVTPRTATVQAMCNSVVWVIGRVEFKDIMKNSVDGEVERNVKYIEGVPILAKLAQDDKVKIAKAMQDLAFTKGDLIIKQGEEGDTLYILTDGKVAVFKDGKAVKKLEASAEKNTCQIFGEHALLKDEPRTASIKVISDTASVLAMDRDSIGFVLGPLSELDQARSSQTVQGPKTLASLIAEAKKQRKERQGMKIYKKDLKRMGVLGVGGLGSVELMEHRKTKAKFALKSMSKGYIVKSGMKNGILQEKDILFILDNPFIVKFFESYNYSQTLYFLFEAAMGGELNATYHRKGLHGSDRHCKYYTASIIFAFQHMHKKRVVYRDTKPENMLLTERGGLKLADMDCAKFLIGKTYTTCGTPEYFAPEVIASSGHSFAVDWWSLGILAFELMSGTTPFAGNTPMDIYSKVREGIDAVEFPSRCHEAATEFVKALLKKNPSERIMVRPGGFEKLKKLKFFSLFDWNSAMSDKMHPPFKPSAMDQRLKEIASFHVAPEDLPPHIVYNDDGSGWDKDFATSC